MRLKFKQGRRGSYTVRCDVYTVHYIIILLLMSYHILFQNTLIVVNLYTKQNASKLL